MNDCVWIWSFIYDYSSFCTPFKALCYIPPMQIGKFGTGTKRWDKCEFGHCYYFSSISCHAYSESLLREDMLFSYSENIFDLYNQWCAFINVWFVEIIVFKSFIISHQSKQYHQPTHYYEITRNEAD